jgi:hypothetical protein
MVHFEVFLAVGYAAFLLCVATGLDLLARHSHARSQRYRTAGFTYNHTHDAWICPEDQILTRSQTDHERRLVRYRGRPQICNHCPSKGECTDSDDGREVVHAMDPWPHSEVGRFHQRHLALRRLRGRIDPRRRSLSQPRSTGTGLRRRRVRGRRPDRLAPSLGLPRHPGQLPGPPNHGAVPHPRRDPAQGIQEGQGTSSLNAQSGQCSSAH